MPWSGGGPNPGGGGGTSPGRRPRTPAAAAGPALRVPNPGGGGGTMPWSAVPNPGGGGGVGSSNMKSLGEDRSIESPQDPGAGLGRLDETRLGKIRGKSDRWWGRRRGVVRRRSEPARRRGEAGHWEVGVKSDRRRRRGRSHVPGGESWRAGGGTSGVPQPVANRGSGSRSWDRTPAAGGGGGVRASRSGAGSCEEKPGGGGGAANSAAMRALASFAARRPRSNPRFRTGFRRRKRHTGCLEWLKERLTSERRSRPRVGSLVSVCERIDIRRSGRLESFGERWWGRSENGGSHSD